MLMFSAEIIIFANPRHQTLVKGCSCSIKITTCAESGSNKRRPGLCCSDRALIVKASRRIFQNHIAGHKRKIL